MKFEVTLDVITDNDPAIEDVDTKIALRYFLIEVLEVGIINLPHNSKNTLMNDLRQQIHGISFDLKKENIKIKE